MTRSPIELSWGQLKTKSKCESDVTAQLILNLSFFLLPMTLKAKENKFKSEIDMIAPGSSDSTVEEEIEDCQKEHWQNSHH